MSIPFVLIGTLVCVQRLRNAGLAPGWVVLFFLVPLNLILFIFLASWPERKTEERVGASEVQESGLKAFLDRTVPQSQLGAAAMGLGLTVLASIVGALFCVNVIEAYGVAVFLGTPFFLGFSSAVLYSYHERRTRLDLYGIAGTAVIIFAALLLVLAVEGLLCIAMAAPLAGVAAMMGAEVAYQLQGRADQPHPPRVSFSGLLALGLLSMPALGTVERVALMSTHDTPHETIYDVVTSRTVAAPPEAVWRELVAFSTIPEPTEWYFRAGIAYPIKAEIVGQGVGAVRYCRFQTGAFVEPITVWEPGRRLAFDVAAQPLPMIELTPYRHLDTPHLDGFFLSKRGEFRLEELPNGHTRLTGTTWYVNRLHPVGYWNLFTQPILHAIHERVLNHIVHEAERGDAAH